MSAIVTQLDDAEVENALQQIFIECEASMSVSTSPGSTASTGEDVPIAKIVEYIKDQLPSWSIGNLVELWKCLVAASTNERVNLLQFKQATKCWIAKAQRVPSLQDGNNNAQEGIYIMSDADSLIKMDVDKEIVEVELRMKLREINEENILLRDEIERQEAIIENLKLQCNISEKQLDRYIQKCQQLEKENDEQRDKLNEAINNGKALTLARQKCRKDYKDLLKQLEIAEIEVQAIPSLKDKMEKISKEKIVCVRQITKLQEEFDEREDECKQLKTTLAELKNTSSNMRESYEYTIRNLREKNRQLVDENTELQSLSILDGERHSISPIPNTDGCCTHSTPYKLEKVARQDSLYAELMASGFNAAECSSRNDLCRLELEGELEQYDVVISAILEQLEKVAEAFVTMRSSPNDVPQLNSQDADAKTCNIEALKRKVAFLLHMATEEIMRRNTEDANTQLRTDSVSTTEDLHQFGVTSFHDALTRAQSYTKAKTDLWPITLQCVESNKNEDSDSCITNAHIINPIVEELNEIIESTLNSLTNRKDRSGNSRHRSIYTLPSSSQILQPSSSSAEDSSYQSSRTNSPDAFSARGDGLKQEDCGEKSITESHDVPDQEKLINPEENSCEMSKISNLLQMDSKANGFKIASNEMNDKSFQIPEVSSASNPISPRRKISVYCRSFDVVATQDSHQDQSDFVVKQSTSNSAAQTHARINETAVKVQNDSFKYQFNHSYRSAKNDSDSSNGSTPKKEFRDSLLENEPLPEQPRKVYLAPTRLKLPQGVKNELDGTIDCASSAVNSEREKNDNVPARSSSTFIVDKSSDMLDSVFETELHSANKNLSQGQLTSINSIPYDRSDSAKFTDAENPHSQASVLRTDSGSESQPRLERSVDNQMSSREDSSVGSDSECEAAVAESNNTASAVSSTLPRDSTFTKVIPCKNVIQNSEKTQDQDSKQKKRQRLLIVRRSFSEGENKCWSECHCEQNDSIQSTVLIQRENQARVFPSLTDIRLQESGIANLSDTELSNKENLNELELQKRYIAFSLCLCTDRVTLPRRVAMSLRQRDQSEKNLSNEVQKMQQDIQDLAPLCTDRESVERVERVRHQLGMIARCAHRVSCAAETLGAVHQELRVSRAVLLADRYLQVLQSRCEKLASNIAETKRILIENNIVIEENSTELSDDLPRIRYRSNTPVNNRIMMTRRRASIATMSRPMSAQDVIKDTVRQRNSVSGRMTLRRPSLSSESPKWEIEKLNRTDSSNSVNELRGIFEQAESRRSSTEENNNMLRLNHCNSKSVINCTAVNESWSSKKQETSAEHFTVNENAHLDCNRPFIRSSQVFCLKNISWRMMLWGILIFFLGFFVNQTISTSNVCNDSLNGWSIEEIFRRYIQRNAAPHPV